MKKTFRIGDKVRVEFLVDSDRGSDIKKGDIYTVKDVDASGDVYVETDSRDRYVLFNRQVERVETPKMTFGEMIGLVAAGEFPKNTAVKREGRTLYVGESFYGYGLAAGTSVAEILDVPISSNDINAMWTAELPEEEVKEVTVAELQEQLGYKIKIVE